MNNFNHLLRSKQAAAWLGISLSTFYKYVKQGLIPPATYRRGKSVAWDSNVLHITPPQVDINKTIKNKLNKDVI
ncbi:hypothetical protein CGJ29_19935 [Vibrio parahaemolyticus]|uniref:helix-turn-helix transcriptional regulator n=1 Tax=Vibrio parahaemolyticus TaxID=670 RepID=UPI00111E1E7C|nr:hypothetical protein CGJ29_19935 [Vibrio parahaemolyticus]